MPTRIGIGDNRIDHAAGVPLSARRSRPDLVKPRWARPVTSEPPVRFDPRTAEAPIELPLRRTWIVASTILGVLLVPIGICLGLYLGSEPTAKPTPYGPSRADQALQPTEPAAATSTASQTTTDEPSAATPAEAQSSTPPKHAAHSASKRASPIGIRPRAAPVGLPARP